MRAPPFFGSQTIARIISVTLAATAPWMAQAQTADSASRPQGSSAQLGKISVEAGEDETSYTADTVSIGKTGQSLRETPQSVSVITRQRLEDQNLTSLNDALEQITGITVTGSGGGTPYMNFYSRGFLINTIQRDGVPVLASNPVSYAQPDLATYDRVEVLRGASGLFVGAGEPGGTINLVRKRALADTQFVASASAGSWNNYRLEADLTGGLNASDSLRGRVVGVHQDRDYFFDAASGDLNLFYGRLDFDIAPSTLLSVGGTYEKRDTPYTNGVPRYTDGSDLGVSRSTYLSAAFSNWDFEKPEYFAQLEHQFNSRWSAKVAVTRATEDSDYKSATFFGAVTPGSSLSAPITYVSFERHESTQNAVDLYVTGKFDAFGHEHDLVIGGNYWKNDKTLLAAYPAAGPYAVNVFNFDPRAIVQPARPAAWQFNFDYDTTQSGYYALLRLRPADRLTVGLGARWSSYSDKLRNVLTGVTPSDYEVNDEMTPYGSVIYDLNDVWSLYGSYAEIFQAQANYTFTGKLLPPLEGANYEAGIKGALREGALNVSFAVFQIDQTNRAQNDPAHPFPCLGSPTSSCSIASGEVRSKGFETEIAGRILPNLDLFAGYTYNSTEYLKDSTATGAPSDNQGAPFSTFTPKHLLRLWAQYDLSVLDRRLRLGTGVTAQSSFYTTDGTARLEQGGYALWNASASYTFTQNWTVSLNGNNLLDKRYYDQLGNTNYSNYFGEPRNVTLRVRAQF